MIDPYVTALRQVLARANIRDHVRRCQMYYDEAQPILEAMGRIQTLYSTTRWILPHDGDWARATSEVVWATAEAEQCYADLRDLLRSVQRKYGLPTP